MKSFLLEMLIINSIISAILVIIAKNPIVSVIFLISLILNSALFLIVKGMYFIGISYILVYLGAIIVLFLFVIMMINIKLTDILEIGYQYTKNIPLALTVSGLFFYVFFNVLPSYLNNATLPLDSYYVITMIKNFIFFISNNTLIANADVLPYPNNTLLIMDNWPETFIMGYSHITSIAYSLYTYGASWFLLTGIILLLGMIAPIYLSKKS